MRDKNRRARTGCLTCRARRVKCDEQEPDCRRCIVANVACAGYEQRRVVVPVKHQDCEQWKQQKQPQQPPPLQQHQEDPSSSSSPASQPRWSASDDPVETASSSASFSSLQMVQPKPAAITNSTRTTGIQAPLVAFPSGPHQSQCPSLGARHVLGYHQVHLRTLPILFAPERLSFWQDELLQEAWGCDYLYLTLVALGNIHRAALMTVSDDRCDQANGLDMKITAVQLYTQALESLAEHLEEAKYTPVLLVAALCLMAYFEAFSGNIPAFIGRIQAADHYFTTLLPADLGPGDDRWRNRDLAPLRDCLRSLGQTCYVTLPLKSIHATTEQHLDAFYHKTVGHPIHSLPTALTALYSLVDLISEDHEIEELVWSPIAPYARETSAQAIGDFEQRLECWKTDHIHLIPELDSKSALSALLVYRWSTFVIPPPAYKSTTRYTSLAAAHYNFYKARIKWALLLLGDDKQHNKLTADFYFYEVLRHAASHVSFLAASASSYSATTPASWGNVGGPEDGSYVPCEALRVGLLPVLHITGLCSPEPRWLEWIKGLSDQIVQEGVLKGHTFATNLEALHIFETHRHNYRHRCGGERNCPSFITSSSSSLSSPPPLPPPPLEQYPDPAERIICQLIPETDGRHFTSFFAAPALSAVSAGDDDDDDDRGQTGLAAYRVVGDARWRCGYGEGPCTPIYNMYNDDSGYDNDDGNTAMLQHFSTDWLYSSQPARDWLSWSGEKEFCMEGALRDHINGTRLLLARSL